MHHFSTLNPQARPSKTICRPWCVLCVFVFALAIVTGGEHRRTSIDSKLRAITRSSLSRRSPLVAPIVSIAPPPSAFNSPKSRETSGRCGALVSSRRRRRFTSKLSCQLTFHWSAGGSL